MQKSPAEKFNNALKPTRKIAKQTMGIPCKPRESEKESDLSTSEVYKDIS